MSAPAVSIVLPTQGTRASLAPSLQSALAQDFSSFEIVVVDDSVAGAVWRRQPAVATCLADPRVRVVPFHQERGCAAAKNAGLRAAQGEWVCYVDDDNTYRSGKIGAQHARAVASGSPVVLCGFEIHVSGRRRLRQVEAAAFSGDELLLRAHADTNVIFHQRATDVRWDESLGTVDDACFFQALVARHGLKQVPNVPEPLVIYHAHSGARANRGFERFYRGQRCLVAKWAGSYSPAARRVLLLRSLIAFSKYRPESWGRFVRWSSELVRVGGWREWRGVANAAGVRIPWLRRWMVT